MLEEAMEGDELISIATLKPGYEHDYYSRPPIHPTICIGRVTAYEQTEQGTYNLLLAGFRRAEIDAEIEPVRSYRRASVTLIEEHISGADEKSALGRQLAKHLQRVIPAIEPLLERYQQGELSLATLTDVAAFYLPLPTDCKLRLLAEGDVAERGRQLLASLQGSDSGPQQVRPRFPTDFSSN
jgi:Lon protease-like protein